MVTVAIAIPSGLAVLICLSERYVLLADIVAVLCLLPAHRSLCEASIALYTRTRT